MICAEASALPDLMRTTSHVYKELSAGRQVPRATLRWVIREAGLQGVFKPIRRTHGADAVKDIILAFEYELNFGLVR
ncbi:hypothetical protein EBO15_09550 [Actinomadura harenae]|uniref:Uncharacterized protein n=2 Tax=Actinomadura harenae TaxID=2483351 RepID=A0A3M2M8U1_9ACTN|nr:hypothetical protein EBO15_09550 [Actinomadura harenae]